jgi:hypothetical protein
MGGLAYESITVSDLINSPDRFWEELPGDTHRCTVVLDRPGGMFVKCGLDECIRRDPKGLYERALLPPTKETSMPPGDKELMSNIYAETELGMSSSNRMQKKR